MHSLATPQNWDCSFRADRIVSNSASGRSACRRNAPTNDTRAATQMPQMKSGDAEVRKPSSRATRQRSDTARTDARHVDPYGSIGAPVDSAGYA